MNAIRTLVFLMVAILNSLNANAATLISQRFCADPSVHFFAGKFYLYATNDQDNSGKYWDSTDWRLFTSTNLNTWEDNGSFLSAKIFAWAGEKAKAWAPEAAERNHQYYFYAPVGGKQIGVAVSQSPQGPFKDARQSPLVESPRDQNAGDEPIDPAVFIDDDGQAYLYFGTRIPKVVALTKDMIHLQGEIKNVVINGFPADDAKKKYGEAPYLHKHQGLYYFSFSTGWPGQIVYATASSPLGPFQYRGVIIDYLPISTNHHAIIEHEGETTLFYHNKTAVSGGNFKRHIFQDKLTYTENGEINPISLAQ